MGILKNNLKALGMHFMIAVAMFVAAVVISARFGVVIQSVITVLITIAGNAAYIIFVRYSLTAQKSLFLNAISVIGVAVIGGLISLDLYHIDTGPPSILHPRGTVHPEGLWFSNVLMPVAMISELHGDEGQGSQGGVVEIVSLIFMSRLPSALMMVGLLWNGKSKK